jgi:hypothetical protein
MYKVHFLLILHNKYYIVIIVRVTRLYGLEDTGFYSRRGKKISLLCIKAKTTLWPTQPLYIEYVGNFSRGKAAVA